MKYENAIESLENILDFIKQQQTALERAYSLQDLEAARVEVIKEIAERYSKVGCYYRTNRHHYTRNV